MMSDNVSRASRLIALMDISELEATAQTIEARKASLTGEPSKPATAKAPKGKRK